MDWARNTWHNDLPFVSQIRPKIPEGGGGGYFQKNWVGVCSTLPETLTLFQTKICDFPDPISDLKPWSLACDPESVTSCYGRYTVFGVNIKREMFLSPNDEEVANSSKKHTHFKTRVHKSCPVSEQIGRNWYPIADQNGWKTIPFPRRRTYPYSLYKGLPLGAKNALQIYESLCLCNRE